MKIEKLTKEFCKNIALKYKYKKDFYTNENSVYLKMSRNGWIDELCFHMINLGNKYKRCIYVAEFSDNCVYVGLTYNFNKRKNEHLTDKKSSVYKYILKSGITPKFNKLTDYIDVDIAKIKEKEYVEKYKAYGWNVLNKTKTGAIGTNEKWTKEKCKTEALKYNKRIDFQNMSNGAYSRAQKNGWLYEICKHMLVIKKENGYYDSFENCLEKAKYCKNKKEFQQTSAYRKSIKNKWLNDIYLEMEWKDIQKPLNYWNFDNCLEETKKYKSIKELIKNNNSVYQTIIKNDWKEKIWEEMKWKKQKK